MINAVKIELNKALKSKLFFIAVAIGCIITLFNTVYFVQLYLKEISEVAKFEVQFNLKYNTVNAVATPFGRWIGMEGFSLGSSILYFVFPLLIAIPYGWSYFSERKNGYEKNFVIRSGKTNYYLAKYIALFVSGGLTMAIPLIFNFISLAMFLPLVPPNVSDFIYYGISPPCLMSMIYYSHPYLYVLSMCALAFVFCGLIACLCYTASIFIKNRISVILAPFALLVALRYIQKYLIEQFPSLYYNEINPMYFLRGQSAKTTFGILIVVAFVLLVITLGVILVRGRKHEIY